MKQRHWEDPICNLCYSVDREILWKDMVYWEYPGVFQIVKCNKCKLVYLSPRPKIEEINKYYVQENYFGRNIENTGEKHNDLEEREKTYGIIYQIILNSKKKGKILDIGAGTGFFLSKFKDFGWQIGGTELNREAIKYANNRYGVSLRAGDFLTFCYKEKSFDVITLNGALEHLYDPTRALTKIHKLLKVGGMILFTVPNVESIGNRIFGRNWFPWQPPRHLYHFSSKTVKEMLIKAGFKDIKIEHNYWLQNYYILFQSLRYSLSPKFKTNKSGGLMNEKYRSKFSLKIELGKIVGTIFALLISSIEPWFKKGEIIIVYAKK